MKWTDLIKQFRLSRGLNQADLAELCGVKQAAVSKWESGTHVPDRVTRNRLRAIFHAQDSKADQAILRSVRYAYTCSGLSILNPARAIEISLGCCHVQGASHADLIRFPQQYWFMYCSPTPDVFWANLKALKNGDLLAIQVKMEMPNLKMGRMAVASTLTPLWFSDGTFVLRGDTAILSPSEYQGQSVKEITHDDMASEP